MDRIELSLERVEVLVSWCVRHEYFEDQSCRCVELLPDRSTVNLLKRRDVKFKRLGVNVWALVGKKDMVWDEEDKVVLRLRNGDLYFDYYTEGELPQSLVWEPGMPEEIELDCKAKCLKWEYVILFGDWREDCRLELAEAEGKLEFEKTGVVEMNGMKGFCMVSTLPVQLREKYDYQLRLSEKKPFGYKILRKRLQLPEPGRFPECGEGCIRKVVVI